ncbi:hypothetical protein RYX36_014249, partial [Vicia faba]
RIDGLVTNSGPYYPDMIRDFYANLAINPRGVFRSKVKDIVIGLYLEKFGNCLGIPFEGERIVTSFTRQTPAWKDYSKPGEIMLQGKETTKTKLQEHGTQKASNNTKLTANK